jgi:TonB family protein
MKLYAGLLMQEGRSAEANKMQDGSARIFEADAARVMSERQPSGSDVYRVGGDVSKPVLLSKVEPKYSEDARLAKYQGTALLSIEIGGDGFPRNIRVIRSLGLGLDQKAVEALRQWRFKPSTRNGQPVKVAATVEMTFRLL